MGNTRRGSVYEHSKTCRRSMMVGSGARRSLAGRRLDALELSPERWARQECQDRTAPTTPPGGHEALMASQTLFFTFFFPSVLAPYRYHHCNPRRSTILYIYGCPRKFTDGGELEFDDACLNRDKIWATRFGHSSVTTRVLALRRSPLLSPYCSFPQRML
jgi:hypothetical protein